MPVTELLARIAALEENQRNSMPALTNLRGRTPMDLRGLAPRSETAATALRLNTGQRPSRRDTPATATNVV